MTQRKSYQPEATGDLQCAKCAMYFAGGNSFYIDSVLHCQECYQHATAFDRDKFLEDYGNNHKFCPMCGNSSIRRTLMACGVNAQTWDSYRDTNRASCDTFVPAGRTISGCGWQGTVHDLVETSL